MTVTSAVRLLFSVLTALLSVSGRALLRFPGRSLFRWGAQLCRSQQRVAWASAGPPDGGRFLAGSRFPMTKTDENLQTLRKTLIAHRHRSSAFPPPCYHPDPITSVDMLSWHRSPEALNAQFATRVQPRPMSAPVTHPPDQRTEAPASRELPLTGMHYFSSNDLSVAIANLKNGSRHGSAPSSSPVLSTTSTLIVASTPPSRSQRPAPLPPAVGSPTSLLLDSATSELPPPVSFTSSTLVHCTPNVQSQTEKKLPPPTSQFEAIRLLEQCSSRLTTSRSMGGTSKFRGVHWTNRSSAWRAKVNSGDLTWHLGLYANELLAAQAYDAGAWFLHGATAKVNFR
jgi:hypothetical protein